MNPGGVVPRRNLCSIRIGEAISAGTMRTGRSFVPPLADTTGRLPLNRIFW